MVRPPFQLVGILSPMDCLADDIFIFEILSRLPPKSIVDSKSVSKQWHKIISTKLFQSRYKSNITKNPGQYSQLLGFIPVYINQLLRDEESTSDSVYPAAAQIVATSNGLLLNRDRELRFSIYNPITGEKPVFLPREEMIIENFAVGFNVLSTDAIAVSIHRPEFDIVLLQLPQPYVEDNDWLRLRTFSSETWSWSGLQGQWLGKSGTNSIKIKPCQNAVVYNQTYYWHNGTKSILKYELSYGNVQEHASRKKLGFIQLPQSSRGYQHNSSDDTLLGVTADGLLRYAESRTYNKILIWFRVSDVWESRYSVRFKMLCRQLPDLVAENGAAGNSYVQPVAFDPLNPNLVFLKFGGRITACDQESKILKSVEVPECKGLVRFPWRESSRTRLLPYFSSTWAADFVFPPREEI